MKIGICDDNQYDRAQVREICGGLQEEMGYRFEILEFETAEELLAYEGEIAIVFLDIMLGETTGLELRRQLIRKRKDLFVIYMTDYPEYIRDSHGRNVIGFLDKPIRREILKRYLETALYEKFLNLEINLGNEANPFWAASMDVWYIKSQRNYCEFAPRDKFMMSRDTLEHWKAILEPYGFVQIHRQYLVNLTYVKNYAKGELELTEGERLPVGKSHESRFLQAWWEYQRKAATYC